jgi:transposase
MAFIRGINRGQAELMPAVVEDWIKPDAAVRVIDAYVARLDLQGLGFVRATPAATGRPGYSPAILLKLYLYGYGNRIRASRALERECARNVELMWLLERLAPDFKTIADFRRENAKALLAVARDFVVFCRGQGLIAGQEVAVDGSKFAAVNSRQRLVTEKSLSKERVRIEQRIAQYLAQLDEADEADSGEAELKPDAVRRALAALQAREAELTEAEEQLAQSGEKQVALSDPDSRLMRKADGGYGMSHNVQVAVDTEHKLIVSTEVTSEGNDRNQLRPMVEAVKAALGTQPVSVLVDSGYSNGEHAAALAGQGIEVSAPHPGLNNNRFKLLPKSAFTYEPEADRYRCPDGRALVLAREHRRGARRIYLSTSCEGCTLKPQCTPAARRHIVRHAHQDVLDSIHARATQPERMRRRAACVEHVIGGLKWLMNGGRLLVKGAQNVRAELALAATAYNLRRAVSLRGTQALLRALAA